MKKTKELEEERYVCCVLVWRRQKKWKKKNWEEKHTARGEDKGVEGYGIEVCWYLIGGGEKKEEKRKQIWTAKNEKGKKDIKVAFWKVCFWTSGVSLINFV